MSKIIIENRSVEVTDLVAIDLVKQVIFNGRISNDGKQYCYLTTALNGEVHISAYLNKNSDRFVVYDAPQSTGDINTGEGWCRSCACNHCYDKQQESDDWGEQS